MKITIIAALVVLTVLGTLMFMTIGLAWLIQKNKISPEWLLVGAAMCAALAIIQFGALMLSRPGLDAPVAAKGDWKP